MEHYLKRLNITKLYPLPSSYEVHLYNILFQQSHRLTPPYISSIYNVLYFEAMNVFIDSLQLQPLDVLSIEEAQLFAWTFDFSKSLIGDVIINIRIDKSNECYSKKLCVTHYSAREIIRLVDVFWQIVNRLYVYDLFRLKA